MATAVVNVQVLDVGQGSGNLIERYDSSGALAELILIDLGSEVSHNVAGAASAQYVVNQILAKGAPSGLYTLDAVILTHSDSDHINLLTTLLECFKPPGQGAPELKIGRILYGGDRDRYIKNRRGTVTNYLTLAERYLPLGQQAESFPEFCSGYSPATKKWSRFYPAGQAAADLELYLIVGNTVAEKIRLVQQSKRRIRKVPDGFAVNTKSLVVDVYMTGTAFNWVITGDATGLTVAHCNQILAVGGPISNCWMLTAPHHGSERTLFDLAGADSSKSNREALAAVTVRQFAERIGAHCLSASAEQSPVYKHPSIRVLREFSTNLGQGAFHDPVLPAGRHFYNAYFKQHAIPAVDTTWGQAWPPSKDWATIQTEKNLFTTLYMVANQQSGICMPPMPARSEHRWEAQPNQTPPPLGAQWGFLARADRTTGVVLLPNRQVFEDAIAMGAPLADWPGITLDPVTRRPCGRLRESVPPLDDLRALRVPLSRGAQGTPSPTATLSALKRLRQIR